MVKDILREIKQRWTQFLAIAIIISLGVGFLIGIQVTGHNMRETLQDYMNDSEMLDYELRYSLGFDEDMMKEVQEVFGDKIEIKATIDSDVFIKNHDFDDVIKIIELDENTKHDLTLLEGEMPKEPHEIVMDSVMKEVYNFEVGDSFKISQSDVFEDQEVKLVGFVKSALYLNLERGQTRLGTGTLQGFAYALELEKKENIFTSLRLYAKDISQEELESTINSTEESLKENRFQRLIKDDLEEIQKVQESLDREKNKIHNLFLESKNQLASAKLNLQDTYEELELGLLEINHELPASELIEDKWQASFDLIQLRQSEFKLEMDKQEETILQSDLSEEEKTLAFEQLSLERKMGDEEFIKALASLNEIREGITSYRIAEKEILEKEQGLRNQEKEALKEIELNQSEINNALLEIEESDRGSLFLFDREDVIIGHREFYQDSERIEGIGKVFPLIFFAVAVLVTLSTVSRMIDESRMQIGVYKALGYSSLQASLKYVIFTFFAWILGLGLGIYLGFYFIPNLIYDAYRIMYLTPDNQVGITISYLYIPALVSFLSSVVIAFFKSYYVSRDKTAQLLRPAMPKGGQRIMLEKIGFIWSRLSFLYKVSLRNLFRNKMRFLMTILGIGGSFGLLITGFGLKHSIYSIVDKQFDEMIQYDGVLAFETNYEVPDVFDSYTIIQSQSVKVNQDDVNLYISSNLLELQDFIRIQDLKTKEPLNNQEGVWISQKLAMINNLQIGDSIEFVLENQTYQAKITGIAENYVYHFVYMDSNLYKTISNQEYHPNMLFFKSNQTSEKLNPILYEDDKVLSVSYLGDIKSNYKEMMGNFDIVIWVVVGAALSLETVVLINLITMNLSERYKEMATLKVLGFYPKELASYLLRENLILTALSLIFGAMFGKYLHQFVIQQAEIDMLMFNRELLLSSYLLAALITVFLSIGINLFMARKANNINMAEALKTHDD